MALLGNPESPLVGQLRGLHLFHAEVAPCAQRVRFALAEKGFRRGREAPWSSDRVDTLVAEEGTWTSRHVSLIKTEHLTPEYSAIHPNMVVPALVHDGKLHIESMDIIAYVDQLGDGTPLLPGDPELAAQASAWVERGKKLHVSVRHVSFRWGLGRLGRLKQSVEAQLARLEKKGSPEQLTEFYRGFNHDRIPESTYRGHLEALEQAYRELDALLESDGRPFLMGEDFSIADIIWSIKVLRMVECGYPFERNVPALARWFERVSSRPAFQDGVMGRHRLFHRIFRVKSSFENLFGVGLRRAAATV